ncbi:PIN domain-containing protein [sulfur-oxidizing endosymbiont of Gigantopelta aegis]|uniref:PIN domain-containing protein n=1 Tax=sulfur-oxidizing endosymbiont of Gigantopelta aegis TaxID=2794934 RepID=UPI0018DBB63F|nr:PIN domain-containing protein [sulfur-oxidizing endosymbiont of Gigantopelta aegis]
MEVLVDTSVWIDYFRSGDKSEKLDFLIDENLVVINELILAELLPLLIVKKEKKVIRLLQIIKKYHLYPDWEEIRAYQVSCLKSGSNGVGIPDLLIAQNSIQNNLPVYSIDKHFKFMHDAKIGIKLYL